MDKIYLVEEVDENIVNNRALHGAFSTYDNAVDYIKRTIVIKDVPAFLLRTLAVDKRQVLEVRVFRAEDFVDEMVFIDDKLYYVPDNDDEILTHAVQKRYNRPQAHTRHYTDMVRTIIECGDTYYYKPKIARELAREYGWKMAEMADDCYEDQVEEEIGNSYENYCCQAYPGKPPISKKTWHYEVARGYKIYLEVNRRD